MDARTCDLDSVAFHVLRLANIIIIVIVIVIVIIIIIIIIISNYQIVIYTTGILKAHVYWKTLDTTAWLKFLSQLCLPIT